MDFAWDDHEREFRQSVVDFLEANWESGTVADIDAPKHRGISMLVFDRKTPGITVRPLITMGWRHHFNEVFFKDARVPAKNLVGEENRGWYVGATLLDFERSNISGAVSSRRTIDNLLEYTRSEDGQAKSRLAGSDPLRHEVADRYIETEVGYQFSFRVISMQNAGLAPNYEASTSKMFISELDQRLPRTGTKVFGLYSNIWEESAGAEGLAPLGGRFTRAYVNSIPRTIAGGSSEIQRNIIATRGLGLPGA